MFSLDNLELMNMHSKIPEGKKRKIKKYNQQSLSNLLRLTFLLNMFEVFYLHVVHVKC